MFFKMKDFKEIMKQYIKKPDIQSGLIIIFLEK